MKDKLTTEEKISNLWVQGYKQKLEEAARNRKKRVDYDKQWNVSGYYDDNDGNDVRDRD